MTFILFASAKKPSPEHGDTGEGLSDWREIKKTKFTCSSLLLLHAARYCYYIQLVTPSDAATAVTIDNKI